MTNGGSSNAIPWKYRTGSPWMDLPAEFGSWKGNKDPPCIRWQLSASGFLGHSGAGR
ncbi:hypothetical protein DNK56_17975 [Streptomyces sp. AC1-42W]|nr:hypothetical protein DNK55_13500 [Streptomyces sp. AC1-42T]PZT84024.1 hypothetical protein DNK56_17925 [Streptomyces sp. AC1-42W]PZT84025.1 hypothetical protein DNK56_17975 [Streptomyces sp. AC1-42W]